MSATFRVILTGCQPGVPLSIAARSLAAARTDLSVEQAKVLLAAGEWTMKAGLTADQAGWYRTYVEKGVGCRCRVEQDATGTAPPDASGQASAPPVAGLETVLRGVDVTGCDAEQHEHWVDTVDVQPGQFVGMGEILLTLDCADESFLYIRAPTAGVVMDVLVEPGQPVSDGFVALNMQVPAEVSTTPGLVDPGYGLVPRPAPAVAGQETVLTAELVAELGDAILEFNSALVQHRECDDVEPNRELLEAMTKVQRAMFQIRGCGDVAAELLDSIDEVQKGVEQLLDATGIATPDASGQANAQPSAWTDASLLRAMHLGMDSSMFPPEIVQQIARCFLDEGAAPATELAVICHAEHVSDFFDVTFIQKLRVKAGDTVAWRDTLFETAAKTGFFSTFPTDPCVSPFDGTIAQVLARAKDRIPKYDSWDSFPNLWMNVALIRTHGDPFDQIDFDDDADLNGICSRALLWSLQFQERALLSVQPAVDVAGRLTRVRGRMVRALKVIALENEKWREKEYQSKLSDLANFEAVHGNLGNS